MDTVMDMNSSAGSFRSRQRAVTVAPTPRSLSERGTATTKISLVGVACAIVVASGPAQGQELPLPSAEVTPPHLTTDRRAEYPQAALRDHVTAPVTVVLLLEVDSQGAVSDVAVKESRGHGFDEAAIAAARNFRFDPARRGGGPVASGKASAEPDESLAPGEETTALYRLAPEVATRDTAEEITVRGQRPPREVLKRTLSKDEIERSPGTNSDALQSLQNLPGVARPPPLSGLLIVRGSAPQDTGIYVDGTNIPVAYHFGGLSSVVPTELLQKVDFYPGNFSAQYGRGMGGVVDIGLRDPRKYRLHGMAQVDAIDVRLLAEGPVFNTGWSFLVAGRRSNPLIDAATAATASGVTTVPQYYDFQAML